MVLSAGDEISVADLPEEIRTSNAATAVAISNEPSGTASFLGESDFREAKRQFEITYLKRKLESHRWNVSRTAEEIGLHRQSLQEKLRELRCV